MKPLNYCLKPEYGLQIEPTLAAGDRQGVEHLFRYWFAWSVAKAEKPKRIFDLGCGCGYGARILSEGTNADVAAIDCDKPTLNAALAAYGNIPRVRFIDFFLEEHWTHDLFKVKAELIVAFELLEQLRHRDFFLEQLVRAMQPGGTALFSSRFYRRQQCHAAPKDKRYFLYNRHILQSLLKRYFREVYFIADDDDRPPGDEPDLHQKINQYIRENVAGEPFEVGNDLIYCRNQIT